MALTITEKKRVKMGNAYAVAADVTFDSSYPTNGEALAASAFGLNEISLLLCETASGYMFQYDYTNAKLKAYYPRAAVSGTLAAAVAEGATPVTSSAANGAIVTLTGNPAVAAGAGAEVTNATNLSTITTRVMAIGV